MAKRIDIKRYDTQDPLYDGDSFGERSRNKQLLKSLLGKKLHFSTNRMRAHDITFVVEHVEELSLTVNNRPMNCIQFRSRQFGKADQPTVEVPAVPIAVEKEGAKTKLTLSYPKDINITRDFEKMHRETKQDLEIYIEYES